jgi:phage-related protein
MQMEQEIRWVGSSYDDLLGFPDEARQEAGFQLGKVQWGLEPDDWKPFDLAGAGTREIRIRGNDAIFRVMYVTKFKEAIYVLHCFKKQTWETSRLDRRITETRYRAVANSQVN